MADLLGSILSSMEKPPSLGDQETRRKAREQAARLKKLQEQEKQQKVEFHGERGVRFHPRQWADQEKVSADEQDREEHTEFAPSDEELDSYRRGEEWDPQKAEEKRRLKELAQRQEEEAAQQGPVVVSPASDYKDKYSHLIGKGAAKDAAHMLQANKTYGCVPVANKRDTRSIEEAMNEIRAKKRLRQSGEELPPTS
eukprot:bmy_08639T0